MGKFIRLAVSQMSVVPLRALYMAAGELGGLLR